VLKAATLFRFLSTPGTLKNHHPDPALSCRLLREAAGTLLLTWHLQAIRLPVETWAERETTRLAL